MARYVDFADKFLAAVYVESEASGADYVQASDIVEKYGLDYKSIWISQIADEWEGMYFSDVSKVLGGGYEAWSFRLGGQGIRYLEERFGDLDKSQDLPKPGPHKSAHFPDVFPLPQTFVESTDWTGLAKRIDDRTLSIIKERVGDLKLSISQADMDDRTRKNAIARVDAVISLLEAPDPPFYNIVELLNNPIFVALLNISTILQLIFG